MTEAHAVTAPADAADDDDPVVHRLTQGLAARGVALTGARVLLLGLPECDGRGTSRAPNPAPTLVARLHAAGTLVRAVAPNAATAAHPAGLLCVPLTARELYDADAVILLAPPGDAARALVERWATYVLNACPAPRPDGGT
ncbi:hypothetical protein [Streptomyces sp. SPB074]|uniref:hypothetical protein n=1 Tax=Streptomyces sp. (strain SPB074) TaxID=465543 RepID=UPI0001D1E18D|nr:hypothetical protein [Streptomyces sp. SPB074]EFG64592.1 hypothetical protein SSBG_05382 [Streptomyces sp. SPB074]